MEQRRSLWTAIQQLANGMNFPWILRGDFNVLKSPKDKLFGNSVSYGETKDFNECIQ